MRPARTPYFEVSGSGTPVVLIMGILADARAWALQVPVFARTFKTIVFDNRGIGRSATNDLGYAIRDLVDDVVAVLDDAGVGRAHVVGLSMGGMVAQELALTHPDRVDRLVLVCTTAEPHPIMEEHRLGFLKILQDGGGVSLWRRALPVLFSRTFLEEKWETLVEMFGPKQELPVPGIVAQLRAVGAHRSTERLGSIRARTLVLTGAADALVPPECSDLLARGIPGAELQTIPAGSHCVNIENADEFNRIVLQFLAVTPEEGPAA